MKRLLLFVVILVVFSVYICTPLAEKPEINEGSCILIDSKTGQVLYENNSNKKGLFPASTTKIMTSIIALERGNLDSVMTASQAAVDDIGKDGSNIGILPGEQITLDNLLKALLISSANETANIIAENICPTRQEFVDLMNRKAKELGALDTNFVNPCGSHDPNHYTTAADLAKIARYAMTLPKFREIVQEPNYQLPPTNKHKSWPVIATTNKLMLSDKSENYTIIGVKTGYTVPAGYNLVSAAANSEGMELISVVMDVKNDGAQTNVRKYSKELLDYGFENFSLVTLQADAQVYRSVSVQDAEDEAPLDLVTRGEVKYIMPNDTEEWDLKKIPEIKNPIVAPVNKGDMLGHIEFQSNGLTIGKVDLVSSRQVDLKPQVELMNKFEAFFSNGIFKSVVIGLIIIVLFFLVLRVVLRTISRRVNSKRFSLGRASSRRIGPRRR